MRSTQFISNEDDTLFREIVSIRERWGRFHHTLLNTKPHKLDPTMIDVLPPRPLKAPLGDEPSMDEMTEVIKILPNWKAVRPDRLPAQPLKLDNPEYVQ